MSRELVPFLVSRLVGWRPVRWTPGRRVVGDYDGRERTIEVFNAEPADQRGLLSAIKKERDLLAKTAGGPLVVVFHSVRQSKERYADFLRSFPRPIDDARRSLIPPPERCVDAENEKGPHRKAAA